MKERNIVTCILLSLLTCGIYGLYWFVCLTDDVALLSEDHDFSGGKALVLTLLTCGIYGFFWAYRLGKDLSIAQSKHNLPSSDNSLLFVILQVFGLSIVTWGITQSEINKMVTAA